jgi:hypothetical protein
MPEFALVQGTAACPEVVKLADCSPAPQVEQRYVTAVNALIDEAVEHDGLPVLADVLAWTLSRVIIGYGTRPPWPATSCAGWAARCAISRAPAGGGRKQAGAQGGQKAH